MAANNSEHYAKSIFARATNELCKFLGSRSNVRYSILYDTQVEFAYIVKNITNGPDYIAPKFVSKIESLVEKINAFIRESQGQNKLNLRDEFSFIPTGKTYLWDTFSNTYQRNSTLQ